MMMSPTSSSLDSFLLVSPTVGPDDTFDLSCYLSIHADHYPSLLEVSLSIQSLPSVSSADNIPPFPADRLEHKVPVETYLSLHEPSYLGCPSTSPFIDHYRDTGNRVLLAAPTAPRLRTMMKEPLHIGKWLSGLVPNVTFSIWKVEGVRILAWKAEEALDRRIEAFRKRRSARNPKDHEQLRRAKLNRNALVYEREVLSGNERGARISVKVPTTLMDTEANEDTLSFDDLNVLLELGDAIESKSVPHGGSPPPRLMVSTSDAIFPISLESSGDLPDNAPQTLAARRGKKVLPHLSLHTNSHDEVYPSIPTAFLGAAPALSHSMNHPNATAEMDLRSMVSTLQSRRVSAPFLPPNITDGDNHWREDKANMIQETGSHEQALTDISIAEYSDFSLGSSSYPGTASFVVSSTGVGETDSPNTTSMSLLGQLDCSPRQSIGRAPVTSSSPPGANTSEQELKGILMGCRNVRFGSLPTRQGIDQHFEHQSTLDKYVPFVDSTRKRALVTTTSKLARRPSTIASGISIGRQRPPNPFRPPDKRTPSNDINTRPTSTPPSNAKNGRTQANMNAPLQRHTIAQPPKSGAAPPSRLRAITNAPVIGNKNDKRVNIPLNVDENVGRRDSSVCQNSKGAATKKKIQKPLRNIFTRLK